MMMNLLLVTLLLNLLLKLWILAQENSVTVGGEETVTKNVIEV